LRSFSGPGGHVLTEGSLVHHILARWPAARCAVYPQRGGYLGIPPARPVLQGCRHPCGGSAQIFLRAMRSVEEHKASRQSTDARCRARCAPACVALHLFPHWERRTPLRQISGLGPCRRSRTTDRWIRAEIMTWGSNQYSFRTPGFSFCDFEPHRLSTSPQTD
jgi:hypothetical protein